MKTKNVNKKSEPSVRSSECVLPHDMKAAGLGKQLSCIGLKSSCGHITRGAGIAFEIAGEGAWCVPLKELERIVKAARAVRQNR